MNLTTLTVNVVNIDGLIALAEATNDFNPLRYLDTYRMEPRDIYGQIVTIESWLRKDEKLTPVALVSEASASLDLFLVSIAFSHWPNELPFFENINARRFLVLSDKRGSMDIIVLSATLKEWKMNCIEFLTTETDRLIGTRYVLSNVYNVLKSMGLYHVFGKFFECEDKNHGVLLKRNK